MPLSAQSPAAAYLDPALPAEVRARDLVSRLTLEQKVRQMQNGAPAIPELGVPAYNWWNEALHGVARAGQATVFPQAIGLAATWDTALMYRVADVISTEARAKYNEAIRQDNHAQYYGLTFWSPNINIFRDPRWGRGQETYGEDPLLTGQLAVAFITGMQGNDPNYFKVIATAKHYAVHSGPEPTRHSVDITPSARDLNETYLPAFRAAIVEGKAYSIMCAYNRRQRCACLREHRPPPEDAARRVGLQRIRRERLRRDRRHVQSERAQVQGDGGGGFGRGGEGGHGPDLWSRVHLARGRRRGGTGHGSRDRPLPRTPVRRAVQARHVRSARPGTLVGHSVLGE